MDEIIVTTTDFVPGYEVERVLGVVFGNTVRAKHIGKDISALFKNIVGGEIQEYTEMLADARKEALNRLIKSAKELGADAVINVGSQLPKRWLARQSFWLTEQLLSLGR